ncbi:hypothetical protein Caka_0860 [Coraliomargarita akajimensis DSM 45221]|uniref:Uncharacterized protein n=1 Tax=Coraliomargarita akajimensis (strain DSM 45221 / IAM 15411 / JCM 23193 / KCTC 12865 / 04OKA010-24) TaxID=583355 RepID=D5EQB5_CORAD|nr:hypothetical protein Caka_0860 [Coraliomargarita akajimensis DSM 45221]
MTEQFYTILSQLGFESSFEGASSLVLVLVTVSWICVMLRRRTT